MWDLNGRARADNFGDKLTPFCDVITSEVYKYFKNIRQQRKHAKKEWMSHTEPHKRPVFVSTWHPLACSQWKVDRSGFPQWKLVPVYKLQWKFLSHGAKEPKGRVRRGERENRGRSE